MGINDIINPVKKYSKEFAKTAEEYIPFYPPQYGKDLKAISPVPLRIPKRDVLALAQSYQQNKEQIKPTLLDMFSTFINEGRFSRVKRPHLHDYGKGGKEDWRMKPQVWAQGDYGLNDQSMVWKEYGMKKRHPAEEAVLAYAYKTGEYPKDLQRERMRKKLPLLSPMVLKGLWNGIGPQARYTLAKTLATKRAFSDPKNLLAKKAIQAAAVRPLVYETPLGDMTEW